jgi:hypothetical protein
MDGNTDTGSVWLSNEDGTVDEEIQISGITAQWYTATVSLPTQEQKLDIRIQVQSPTSDTIEIYASCLWQGV